jgi:hypothetical protein
VIVCGGQLTIPVSLIGRISGAWKGHAPPSTAAHSSMRGRDVLCGAVPGVFGPDGLCEEVRVRVRVGVGVRVRVGVRI